MSTGIETPLSKEFYEKAGIETQKPFPYLPPQPTERMITRMEMLRQLDLWEQNNEAIAKRHAESLVLLLIEQFGLSWDIITTNNNNLPK